MKRIVLVTLCIFCFDLTSNAQPTGSFYLNTTQAWLCTFSADAIYFYGSNLIKADYDGNVIWTVSPSPFSFYSRIKAEGGSIYGTDGLKVFKFDTAGNSIWTKDFSSRIYASDTNPNFVSDVIFDDNKLFVCIQQNVHTIGNGGLGRQAIITLDTSGNTINAVLDTNFWFIKQTIGFKSLRKGGWLGYVYLLGINHPGYIVKIDSAGNFSQNSYSVSCYGSALLHDVIPMADSTYMVVFNNVSFASISDSAYFFCAKIREDGSIIWSHGYSVDAASWLYTGALNAVVDSLNNTYIVGTSDVLFALKLNNSGNVVLAKGWSHPNNSFDFTRNINDFYFNQFFYGFNATHFKDGKIYCFGSYGVSSKPAVLIFDSLFNNPCYSPDTNVTVTQTLALGTYMPSSNTNTFSYSPTIASFNDSSVANPTKLDLCAALDVKDIFKDNALISIFPNPLAFASTLQLNAQVNNAEVVIYDMVGKEIMREKLTGSRMEIERGSLESGVYFVKMSSGERQLVAKLVVE